MTIEIEAGASQGQHSMKRQQSTAELEARLRGIAQGYDTCPAVARAVSTLSSAI